MRNVQPVCYFSSPAGPRLQFVSCSFRECIAVVTMAVAFVQPAGENDWTRDHLNNEEEEERGSEAKRARVMLTPIPDDIVNFVFDEEARQKVDGENNQEDICSKIPEWLCVGEESTPSISDLDAWVHGANLLPEWDEIVREEEEEENQRRLLEERSRGGKELQTPDKLEYNFYPVTSGSTQFKVKAPNDAHIALTTGPAEGDPMYEIFLGGWGNTKSIIRKNRQKPDKVEVETPGILSGDEFRGFWIRWAAGSIACGKEGEAHPFMSWDDPEPFGIGYYGVCTGWGASGSWLLEDGSKVDTPDRLEYKFSAICKGALEIEVKAPSNAHIALTTGPREADPMYELILGGWDNKQSAIRLNRTKPDKVHLDTPGLLHGGEFRRLTIQWDKGVIQAKKDGVVLIEWRDPAPFGISHFGVRTAWGATGHWKVRNSIPGSTGPQHIVAPRSAPQPGWSLPSAPTGGTATWVPARAGEVPPGAVPGGYDNEQLYVGRARHEGALIPGKVHPSHGVCYVAWGGQEHGKEEYEVLCGCEAAWVPAAQGQVPPGALPSGETEDGEPLFTGRAQHEGTMTVGKVQASHTVCYIPYGGQEIAYPEYEVLVAK